MGRLSNPLLLLYIKGHKGADKLLFPVIELINQASSVIKLDPKSQTQFVPFLGNDPTGGDVNIFPKTVLLVGTDITGREYTADPSQSQKITPRIKIPDFSINPHNIQVWPIQEPQRPDRDCPPKIIHRRTLLKHRIPVGNRGGYSPGKFISDMRTDMMLRKTQG